MEMGGGHRGQEQGGGPVRTSKDRAGLGKVGVWAERGGH